MSIQIRRTIPPGFLSDETCKVKTVFLSHLESLSDEVRKWQDVFESLRTSVASLSEWLPWWPEVQAVFGLVWKAERERQRIESCARARNRLKHLRFRVMAKREKKMLSIESALKILRCLLPSLRSRFPISLPLLFLSSIFSARLWNRRWFCKKKTVSARPALYASSSFCPSHWLN